MSKPLIQNITETDPTGLDDLLLIKAKTVENSLITAGASRAMTTRYVTCILWQCLSLSRCFKKRMTFPTALDSSLLCKGNLIVQSSRSLIFVGTLLVAFLAASCLQYAHAADGKDISPPFKLSWGLSPVEVETHLAGRLDHFRSLTCENTAIKQPSGGPYVDQDMYCGRHFLHGQGVTFLQAEGSFAGLPVELVEFSFYENKLYRASIRVAQSELYEPLSGVFYELKSRMSELYGEPSYFQHDTIGKFEGRLYGVWEDEPTDALVGHEASINLFGRRGYRRRGSDAPVIWRLYVHYSSLEGTPSSVSSMPSRISNDDM